MKNSIHLAHKKRWDAAAKKWGKGADLRGLWRRRLREPQLVLSEKELEYVQDISGKQVCVLGSGDNQVVFALAGLGGIMTSVDISQNQLDIAKQRSRELGLSITFVQADVTDLSVFETEIFDVVYTGGHVAVWVTDLYAYYSEAVRILVPGGLFIVDEYHPFRRIWKDSSKSLVVQAPYLNRGPFEEELSADVLRKKPGHFKSYEFRWTISDYINAILYAGCSLLLVDEHGKEVADWEGAPLQGFPEFLLIVSHCCPR